MTYENREYHIVLVRFYRGTLKDFVYLSSSLIFVPILESLEPAQYVTSPSHIRELHIKQAALPKI